MRNVPGAWPLDPESRQALEEYIEWLGSSGAAGAEMVGDVDLRGAEVRGLDFTDLWLLGANMAGVDATGADFSRANLSGAILENGIFVGASFVRTEFTQARGVGAVFRDATFSAVQVVSSDFRGADFSRVSFKEAGLLKTDATGADFSGSWFGGEGACARFNDLIIDDCEFNGATGVIHGTASVRRRGSQHILSAELLEEYINTRGADVRVIG
ncbi:pentapeptide repeat-containing protein [Nocardiopsis suaedae]|uniref:Pentapeptide repeat-containing protein n=1 Tax=Nocardiopsis suaedae TaxID=3018444 RepID=A0ABT4TL32_9ACTN|nr:pentapeptide repeat-containing protein [Nocardiopsis suaedae]MDA2805420.1 pentapeptide repeat-containing protein [Nocardiopsis suaedae]